MNILLTGGSGYIGSHTAIVLIKHDFRVVIFDNLSNSNYETIKSIEKITSKPFSFVDGDIRNTQLLSATIKDNQIDLVIHFAGLKAVGESFSEPLRYFDNNVIGTISLLNAMQNNNVKKLIFSSSATIYGDPKYLPIDEAHLTDAKSPYGRTKLHIEEILKDLSFADQNWKIICLRYFNPIGAHESGFIGENPKGIPNNLMPFITNVAFGKLKTLTVFGSNYDTPDGTGIRDYIHVMDVAEGHFAALNYILNHNNGWSVFNLGTGKGVSVLEVIEGFNRANNANVSYVISHRRNGDVASIYASVKLANHELSWKAKRSLDEMYKSAWLWRKNLG